MNFFEWRKKIKESTFLHKTLMSKNQNGRSMVEVLGVLAIVGVLSVGGISGYHYAMNKYRANEVLDDVNMRMIDIAQQVYRNQAEIGLSDDWALTGKSGYVMDIFQNSDSEPSIMVEKVPSELCKMLLKHSSSNQDIFVGTKVGDEQVDGDWYLGDNEDICGNDVEREMLFALAPEVLAGFNQDEGIYDTYNPEETVTIPPKLECYANTDCRPEKPICNNGTCVECVQDSHCSSDAPVCDTANKQCVECLQDAHCGDKEPYCSSSKLCTACYKRSNGTACYLEGKDYEGMCYGDANYACVDWCGETPLVGSCYAMNQYCKNQGGRATIYQLMLISDNPLYCKTQRDAGKEVVANYYSTPVYTYTGNCPDTERYKGLWSRLHNTCTDRRGRYISNVDRVEVNRNGSLLGTECGSGNWWSSGACYDDVQAIIDAYDAENPITE